MGNASFVGNKFKVPRFQPNFFLRPTDEDQQTPIHQRSSISPIQRLHRDLCILSHGYTCTIDKHQARNQQRLQYPNRYIGHSFAPRIHISISMIACGHHCCDSPRTNG